MSWIKADPRFRAKILRTKVRLYQVIGRDRCTFISRALPFAEHIEFSLNKKRVDGFILFDKNTPIYYQCLFVPLPNIGDTLTINTTKMTICGDPEAEFTPVQLPWRICDDHPDLDWRQCGF